MAGVEKGPFMVSFAMAQHVQSSRLVLQCTGQPGSRRPITIAGRIIGCADVSRRIDAFHIGLQLFIHQHDGPVHLDAASFQERHVGPDADGNADEVGPNGFARF